LGLEKGACLSESGPVGGGEFTGKGSRAIYRFKEEGKVMGLSPYGIGRLDKKKSNFRNLWEGIKHEGT